MLKDASIVKRFPLFDPAYFKGAGFVSGANYLTMNEVIAACLLKKYHAALDDGVCTHLCAPISVNVDNDCMVTIEYAPKCSVPSDDLLPNLCPTMRGKIKEHVPIALKHLRAMGLGHGDVRTINMGAFGGKVYLFDFDSVAFCGFFPLYSVSLGFHTHQLRDTTKDDDVPPPLRTCCYATDMEMLEAAMNCEKPTIVGHVVKKTRFLYTDTFMEVYRSGHAWNEAFDSDKGVNNAYNMTSWIFEGCTPCEMPRMFERKHIEQINEVATKNVKVVAANIVDIAAKQSSLYSHADLMSKCGCEIVIACNTLPPVSTSTYASRSHLPVQRLQSTSCSAWRFGRRCVQMPSTRQCLRAPS